MSETATLDKRYLDPTLPEEERVNILLSQMTLDEKWVQIAMGPRLPALKEKIDNGTYSEYGYSSSYSNGYSNAENIDRDVDCYNEVQKYQIENTRLGIPLVLHGESLHGLMCEGATVFPQAIGLGATFEPELVGRIAAAAGKEAYIMGVRQTYAPNLDISRDARWGRVEENYGEDPYLTGRMGAAYVKGLQSNNVASSPKHYVAHGTPEGGVNISPVHAGERELREVMLESFASAFIEGKAMSVMPAYSELDGMPIHASRFMMTDLLHGELGFDGYSVSDFGAVGMLKSRHNVAATIEDAGEIAIKAGIDHEAGSRSCYNDTLKKRVEDGEFDISYIDEAVRRVLRIKFRLGLFEDPYAKPERRQELRSEESIALTREAARKSVVMLENNGLLPLDTAKYRKIAVVGPNADFATLGDYSARKGESYSVTLKAALENRIGAENVAYARGSFMARTNDEMLNDVYKAALSSDLVIAVLGDSSNYHAVKYWGDTDGFEEWNVDSPDVTMTCGEGFDSADLLLPEAQRKVLETAAKARRPILLVLECGRPYCIQEQTKLSDAALYAWYPGEQGGNAICDIIFGDCSPSGKLPISFPKSVGQIPCYYNHKTSARGIYNKPGTYETPGRDYIFHDTNALYPFGYGLSYTTFAYSGLTAEVTGDAQVRITVNVANTGNTDADETVLVFVKQHVCPTTPFVKRLRKFTKVSLKAGETKTVTFDLTAIDFSYIDERMKTAVNHGKMSVMIDDQTVEFVI